MKKLPMFALLGGALVMTAGCASTQKGPEAVESGSARSDSDHPTQEAPPKNREVWTKMR